MQKSVSLSRWKQAQESERKFATTNILEGDDWNLWWREKFDNYNCLKNRVFKNALEVGCGSHTNLWQIMQTAKIQNVHLEDPLIFYYLLGGSCPSDPIQAIKWLTAGRTHIADIVDSGICSDTSSLPIEQMQYPEKSMDLVVCINVLDHVYDFDLCMLAMNRVLTAGGVFIIGQDLTNDQDAIQCPETVTDIGHPIKVSLDMLEWYLSESKGYTGIFKGLLARDSGRNPKCHHATYLGIFEKAFT